MKNKHFDSYAERVRAAKAAAKVAAKKVEKPKKKFKTSQIITFVLMVIWTICSVFGVFGFARTFERKNNGMRLIGASALENNNNGTSSYNLYTPTIFTYSPQGLNGLTFINSTGTSSTSRIMTLTKLQFKFDIVNRTVDISYNDADALNYNMGTGFLFTDTIDLNDSSTDFITIYPAVLNSPTYDVFGPSYFSVSFFNSTGTPVEIPIGAVLENIYYRTTTEDKSIVWVDFEFLLNTESYIWTMYFKCESETFNVNAYSPYFIKQLPDSSNQYKEKVTMFSWQDYIDIYNQGQEDIRNNLLSDIEKIKENAYNDGKAAGYQEGLNENNQYTFSNLISAVIDVPIQSFQSLLNFEVLGVNLLAFAESLIFIGLLLFIVKLLI